MLDIVQLLLNDPVLNAIIGRHIYPSHTNYLGDCIVYSFYPLTNDKMKKRMRLKITIIAQDLGHADMIEDRISDLILTLGDQPLVGDILQVELVGGGSLEDSDRNKIHRILYFDALLRA